MRRPLICSTLSIATQLFALTSSAFAQVNDAAVNDAGPADANVPLTTSPDASLDEDNADTALDASVAAPAQDQALSPESAALPAVEERSAPPVQSGDAGLDEMVVTAQRRKTNLQRTPIAITAISGETLRERSAVDLSGVATATPNMQLITSSNASGGSNFAQVFIRGVGQSDFYLTKDPAVGIYVDGVYMARAPGALLELLDIERIEVLRGPQGTLFGKNTAGGAVNVITRKPEGAFGGVAEARIGDYGRRDVSGSFETPLVPDRLSLRITGLARRQDGYYSRLPSPTYDGRSNDGNSTDIHGGRLTLRWTPSDAVDVLLAADTTVQRETGTDYQAIGIFDSSNTRIFQQQVLTPRNQIYDTRWLAPRPWTTYSNSPSYSNSDVSGASGTVSWDLGAVQLKSITAYRALRAAAKTDADGTPIDLVASDGLVVKQQQFSQELQATGNAFDEHLAWVVGLWYFQEHAQDKQSLKQLVGLFDALEAAAPRSIVAPGSMDMCPADGTGPATCLGGMGNKANTRFDQMRNSQRDLRGRSYAAFGQASIKATEALSFTAGARISREEKDFTYYEERPLQGLISFDHVKATPSWNVFTPKLGVEYRITPELMAYASYSLGFKAGGITGRPPAPDQFKAFNPEWLTTYEVGAKSEFFDRRVRLNLAVFYSQYKDIQITRNTVDSQGGFIRLEQNAGNGDIRGFEGEVAVAPTRGLNIAAGMGFTDFKFTSLLAQQAAPGVAVLTLNNKLPFIPKLAGNFSAAYKIALGDAGFLTPRADLSYSSGYFTDIDNTLAVQQTSYVGVNARIAYVLPSDKWELYASMTNIGNVPVVGASVAAPANGSQLVSYRPPRMFYVGSRFTFD